MGINTMVVSPGLGLALPSNAVLDFLRDFRQRATLGVVIRPVPNGLMILEVTPGGAADRGSLLPGDILIGAGTRMLDTPQGLAAAIAEANGRLRLRFLRGGRMTHRETTVRLEIVEANAA
jgi:S1-C subfamily serine protease